MHLALYFVSYTHVRSLLNDMKGILNLRVALNLKRRGDMKACHLTASSAMRVRNLSRPLYVRLQTELQSLIAGSVKLLLSLFLVSI